MDELSSQEVHFLIRQKLQELFSLCDPDNHGYITFDDMLAQKEQLPIPSEQMGIIFETLDKDQRGYLTIGAFVDGLSVYLGQNNDRDARLSSQEESSVDYKDHQLPIDQHTATTHDLSFYANNGLNGYITSDNQSIQDQEDAVFECDLSGDATTDAEIEEFLIEMGMTNNEK